MCCETFSFEPIILEYGKLKIAMKIIDEQENENLCKEEQFIFEAVNLGEKKKKRFETVLGSCFRLCILCETKNRFLENYCHGCFV